MNVTCDKCNKRYTIADDKVRGKAVKIRCKQCQNLISVQGPALSAATGGQAVAASAPAPAAAADPNPWEDERTRAMPALDTTVQWFAMVKGVQIGPFDLKGLEGKVKAGEVSLRTYLWKQGMGDWKRASDVPEVSPVFAGVSVGATATAPVQHSSPESKSKRVAAVQRDVALANEMPSPEVTSKKNGNGHGAHAAASHAAASHGPALGDEGNQSTSVEPAFQPAAATEPSLNPGKLRSPTSSQRAVQQQAKQPAPEPLPAPAQARQEPSLGDLFNDAEVPSAENRDVSDVVSDQVPTGDAPLQPEPSGNSGTHDPFAALGEADPSEAPPPGEATKFFIAQAGVNKRNPPWKIALFVLSIVGLPIGVLYLLSSLNVVPLKVTRINENGEEVQESFFSSGGVTGLKDLLSGEEARKKAAADEARRQKEAALAAAAAAAKKKQPSTPEDVPDEVPETPKPVNPALAALYDDRDKNSKGPRVRLEDRDKGPATASSGLTQEAISKTVADKLKSFESCIEQALRRNPNLSVGPIEVVINVGMSGAVKSSGIDPAKHESSDWGQCMMQAAKRITFPASDGETEVKLPLKVGISP